MGGGGDIYHFNTSVCHPPLFVALVHSFIICFVCRGEGNNSKTMVGFV